MTSWRTLGATQLVALLLFGSCALVSAAEQRLNLTWPDHWEYRPTVQQGPAVQLQARQHRNGETLQQLSITVVDTQAAQKPIAAASIKDLAQKLRDATLVTAQENEIPLRAFASREGYYFMATDKHDSADRSGDFRQLVEGVMLRSGYLINFTLLTNDANGAAAMEMISALDQLSIE